MPIAAFGQKQRPSRFFMTPPRLHYTPPLQSPITVSNAEMPQEYHCCERSLCSRVAHMTATSGLELPVSH